MGRLTTHILDTAQGRPAAGVAIRLFAAGDERRLVASTVSNADGRTDQPLVEIGPYFAAHGFETGEPASLATVVIRFSVASGEHYHVPLLVSPWSYSTYRGS